MKLNKTYIYYIEGIELEIKTTKTKDNKYKVNYEELGIGKIKSKVKVFHTKEIVEKWYKKLQVEEKVKNER